MRASWRRTHAAFRHNTTPFLRHHSIRCSQALKNVGADGQSLENKEVHLNGIIRSVRKQKRWAFAELSDGSTIRPVQVVLTPDQAEPLTTGSSVEISGTWASCPPGKEQTHELQTKTVKVIGAAEAQTFPLQKKYHSADFLRQIPHLRVRTPFNSLLSRFRSEAIFYITQYFNSDSSRPFVQVQPPLITLSDCEGAGEVFAVEPATAQEKKEEPFFGSTRYLTVSSQLHLEAYAAELGNVWTLSPTFRAEKSDTPRHLAEFYMLEAEMQYVDDMEVLMSLIEDMVRNLTSRLQASDTGKELLTAKRTGESGVDDESSEMTILLQKRWDAILSTPKWQRITYSSALAHLQSAHTANNPLFQHAPTWTSGLQLEHEKWLVENISHSRPLFVTDYPKCVKPFYMAPSSSSKAKDTTTTTSKDAPETDTETVANFDLLFSSVAEVAGGSLREHRLPNLLQNMREAGMIKSTPQDPISSSSPDTSSSYPHLHPSESLSSLRWYADLRRWGSAPHGGFGIGFDRLLAYLAGVESLRDVVVFPRWAGRGDC